MSFRSRGGISRKQRIATAFGTAAATYDRAAAVQRQVAERLAQSVMARIRATPPPAGAGLDLGCGTGYLSVSLLPCLPSATTPWLLADLSENMVRRAQTRLQTMGRTGIGVVMDGERPALPDCSCALIVSSLAIQWFENPLVSLTGLCRLLRPGGLLACATLSAGSFAEWRQAAAACGVAHGMPPYPAAAAWSAAAPPGFASQVEVRSLRVIPPGGPREFLRDLKQLGAHVPASGHAPVSTGHFRRLLRFWENREETFAVTYQIAYILVERLEA